MGTGDSAKFANLANCFLAREGQGSADSCDWYTLPPQPGSAAAKQRQQRIKAASMSFAGSDAAQLFEDRIGELSGIPDSSP